MEFKPTYGSFEVIGKVVGMKDSKAYSQGIGTDSEWNRIQFGLKIAENSFSYVELMGSKREKVKLFKRTINNKFDKSTFKFVNWEEAYKDEQYSVTNLIKINIGNELNDKELLPYDAVNYIHNNSIDGLRVLVKGNLNYSTYQSQVQVKQVIREIVLADSTLSYSHPYSIFEQNAIYDSIEINDDCCYLMVQIINKVSDDIDALKYQFILNRKLAELIKLNCSRGMTLKLYGFNKNYVSLIQTENNEKLITGAAIKELEVTGFSVLPDNLCDLDYLDSLKIQGSPFEENHDNNSNKFGF
ncbi:hypothetical protein D3C73_278640 [compost metagenome]